METFSLNSREELDVDGGIFDNDSGIIVVVRLWTGRDSADERADVIRSMEKIYRD